MQGSGDASEGDVQEEEDDDEGGRPLHAGEENERAISYGTRLGQKGGECVRGSNENDHERAFSSRSGMDVRSMERDA